eukprot:760297-Hanusia_phi.AAC.6
MPCLLPLLTLPSCLARLLLPPPLTYVPPSTKCSRGGRRGKYHRYLKGPYRVHRTISEELPWVHVGQICHHPSNVVRLVHHAWIAGAGEVGGEGEGEEESQATSRISDRYEMLC